MTSTCKIQDPNSNNDAPNGYLCESLSCCDVCDDQNVVPLGDNNLRTCLMCDNKTISQFSEAWTSGKCNKVLDPSFVDSSSTIYEQLIISQKKANRVMAISMGTNGDFLDTSGSSDIIQARILNICKGGDQSSSPNACGNYLEFILSQNQKYKYNDMEVNPGIANWLGCFISPPPDQTQVYDTQEYQNSITPTDSCMLAGVGTFPCYPMCHRISTVQRYANTQTCKCNSNVCVIDDVVIQAEDSTVGSVNITQICPGCSPDKPCVCITSSTNMQNTFNETGLSSSFNQYCGTNSVCYDVNGYGELVETDCQQFINSSVGAYSVAIPLFIIIGGILILIIVVTILFATKEERVIIKPKKKVNKRVSLKENSEKHKPKNKDNIINNNDIYNFENNDIYNFENNNIIKKSSKDF